MKSGIAILLILFFCIACVHAAPPTQSCAQKFSGSCGNMPNGNVYFYLNVPYSADTVFMLGSDKMYSTFRSLPSPYDSYTGYQIGLVPGTYTINIRRPGYNEVAFSTEICDCKESFVNVVMVPVVTTTVTTAKTGYVVKPVVSGIALATTTATTTTPASSGSYTGKLQAPTIALQKATTTTGGSQGSGSQAGGSGSQNTGTGTSGSGQTGASQSGSSGSGSGQTGTTPTGGTDTANTGSLSVTTTPAGVSIFIDGVQRGVSPATIPGLAPGDHTLLMKLDGYTDLSTPVSITAGKTTEYTTGLAKAAKSPGFGAVFGIIALGAVLCLRKIQSK